MQSMKRRTIKMAPGAGLSSRQVREAVQAAHVLAEDSGSWRVRTLGTDGKTRQFSSREAAVSYAQGIPSAGSVIVHDDHESIRLPVTRGQQSKHLSP